MTILPKNPTNALIHVNTTLFTLLHSYIYQPSWDRPRAVVTHFMSGSTQQVSRCKYQIKGQTLPCNIQHTAL